MPEVKYLKANPDQFDRPFNFVKDEGINPSQDTPPDVPIAPKPKTPQSNLVSNPPIASKHIDPFFISLLVNGFKLSNYVIDSGAFNNVMPAKVAIALGLDLTKTFSCCFSMDNKKVPLICPIKDVQYAFFVYQENKIKMMVLVADVPLSYGILLGHNFYKDVGGELSMDMFEPKIPLKGMMQKLIPEKESKFSLTLSDDPRAQILFESSGMGTYYLQTEEVGESLTRHELESDDSSSTKK